MSESNNVNSPVRVGLIGTGMMGRVHAHNLQNVVKGAQLIAVADLFEDGARRLADSLGVPRVYRDAEDLIADSEVDAIVIASPDVTHGPFVLEALEARKPVLCEKPLAGTVAEAEEVVAREAAIGSRLVQVGFMREFDASHHAVRAATAAGEIGDVVLFRGQHMSTGGGVGAPGPSARDGIIGALIHDIHSIRFLTGSEIVSAFVRNRYLPDGSVHVITASFELDNGGVATVDVNFETNFGYAVHVDVVGSNGTASTVRPHTHTLLKNTEARDNITQSFQERFGAAYLAEDEAWIASVRQRSAVGPNAWDGYAASAVADACIRSVATGKPEQVEAITRPPFYQALVSGAEVAQLT